MCTLLLRIVLVTSVSAFIGRLIGELRVQQIANLSQLYLALFGKQATTDLTTNTEKQWPPPGSRQLNGPPNLKTVLSHPV